VPDAPLITIPDTLLPGDGRFGSGPSKIRAAAVRALADAAPSYLGTSHRQQTVRDQVAQLRHGLAELLGAPDGYEVVLSNGGTTAFWDAATFGLIRERAQFATFGEFSAKFAAAASRAPFLGPPSIRASEPGTAATLVAEAGIDTYASAHNETSTGVLAPVRRVQASDAGALVLTDATSAAGAVEVDLSQTDAYYFAPQKALGSDGGLWLAVLSPAALERIAEIRSSGRWIPAFLDLSTAVEQSRLNQTYNTPALATIFLAVQQVEWLLAQGGLAWAAKRSAESSAILYSWAEHCPVANPFVADPSLRSPVVVTIDFDPIIDALALAAILRANGIVDTDSYRKLGRNQLRIATFPTIEPADAEALTASIDYVLTHLA
jgi:phosphoserine aminotransferase